MIAVTTKKIVLVFFMSDAQFMATTSTAGMGM